MVNFVVLRFLFKWLLSSLMFILNGSYSLGYIVVLILTEILHYLIQITVFLFHFLAQDIRARVVFDYVKTSFKEA